MFLTIYMAQCVGHKGSPSLVAGSSPDISHNFFHILYRKLYKNFSNCKKNAPSVQFFFRDPPPLKSNESTSIRFES